MKTEILYEDNSILVIRKPAGLAVQSARIGQPDVVSELKSHLAKLPDTGSWDRERRAISGHSPQTGSAGGGRAGICQREKGGSSSDETVIRWYTE